MLVSFQIFTAIYIYQLGMVLKRFSQIQLGDHRELLWVVRGEFPVEIIMLDIDDFKRLNDGIGHAAEDVIL